MDKVLDSALLSSANKRKGILAIGAHPDDIELGCGASLARLAQKGIYIAAVVMTTGNSGTDGIIDRHEESRNALKILGCHQTIHLNFADTRAHLQLNDMISALEDIIKNQIPSDVEIMRVYTMHDADRHQAKAGRIIAIDTNPKKFDLARRFGATDCINPNDYDKPIKDVLLDINKWGIDHTFECIGNVNVMRAALESAHRGWGQSVIIGVAGSGQEISTRPFQLVTGRVWKGSAFGGVKGRSQLPGMVEDAMKGDIDLEPFVTHTMSLDEINDAFDLMHEGKSIRTVIRY